MLVDIWKQTNAQSSDKQVQHSHSSESHPKGLLPLVWVHHRSNPPDAWPKTKAHKQEPSNSSAIKDVLARHKCLQKLTFLYILSASA